MLSGKKKKKENHVKSQDCFYFFYDFINMPMMFFDNIFDRLSLIW